MTMTGLPVFDETLHVTNTWLHELEARCGLRDRQQSYRLLRACLHTLRDHLSVEVSANLSAQLPILIRGIYYEAWQPTQVPKRSRSLDDFLSVVARAFREDADFDASAGFQEFVSVMRRHISPGEMTILQNLMPDLIKPLWEDYTGFEAT